MKKIKIISLILIIMLCMTLLNLRISYADDTVDYKINLSNLTYTVNGEETELKNYTKDDFEQFQADYNSGSLPDVYVTEFLFDGVSMVKTYDLDDFIEKGNDVEVDVLDITAININKTGTYEFSGKLTGGMIAVDTNGRTGEINLVLNGVELDTDSKKAPGIYVYNKDITYTGCKVTIKTASASQNYIEGGKLKKVSLIGTTELSNYKSKYSGENQTNYTTYTNYYGVYSSEQLNEILFAKVQADNEDLADGDPYYYYKASGAISSDIDLYFEGTGYLEVTSKNKEGIETKGNLTFAGGTGDYAIYSEDDCLNTTTDSSENKSARNALTIDVNTLVAIVDAGEDSDEGDAIDSNGTLTINGGTIIALAHPGQDAGLDSEKGTFINGGTVIATGNMYDAISNESKQNFMVLSFQSAQTEGTLIALLGEDDDVVMAYETDRSYTNLIYSSADLDEGTYYLYKDGEIAGTSNNGFYTKVSSYEKGTIQGHSSTGSQRGMNGRGMENQMQNGNFDRGMPSGEIPNGEMPSGERLNGEKLNEEAEGTVPSAGNMKQLGNMQDSNFSATNKEFTISGISNQFSGVANYSNSEDSAEEKTESEESEDTTNSISEKLSNPVVIGGIAVGTVAVIISIVVIAKKARKKKE